MAACRSFARSSVAAAACVAALLAGCNAILGLGDPVILSDAGVPGEGGSDTSIEAPAGDGSLDAPGEHAEAGLPMEGGGSDALQDGSDAPVGAPCVDGGMLGDNDNCGVCGHSCLGGPCSNGACQAFVLAHSVSNWPSGVAVDDKGNVFWANHVMGGAIEECPASTGAQGCAVLGTNSVVTPAPTPSSTPDQIGVLPGTSTLYWDYDDSMNGGGIAMCPMASCSGGAPTFGTTTLIPTSLAVGPNGVVTLSTSASAVILGCSFMGCPMGGALQVLSPSNLPNPVQIVSGGPLFYWTMGTEVDSCDPFAGCTAATHVADLGAGLTAGIATDSVNVYFTDESQVGAVYSCPLMGCTGAPFQLATAEPYPGRLAVDVAYVYWLGNDAGTYRVRSCLLPTCAGGVRTLATSSDPLVSIAVDSVAVYYTAMPMAGQGTVWRLAK